VKLGDVCKRCGETLTAATSYVYRRGGRVVGRVCKPCQQRRTSEWRVRHRELSKPEPPTPTTVDRPCEAASPGAVRLEADGGLYLAAVSLVAPGRFASRPEALEAADRLLYAVESAVVGEVESS
jgi:hypothetical protein